MNDTKIVIGSVYEIEDRKNPKQPLRVRVRVSNVRVLFERREAEIEPECGSGKRWVRYTSLHEITP